MDLNKITDVKDFLLKNISDREEAESTESRVHKTFEKEIPDFLEDRLSNKKLEAFLEHLANCSDCRDELSIQYLVYAGMPKLETGETFNLQNELWDYVKQEEERLERRRKLQAMAFLLEGITLGAMIAMCIAYFFIL